MELKWLFLKQTHLILQKGHAHFCGCQSDANRTVPSLLCPPYPLVACRAHHKHTLTVFFSAYVFLSLDRDVVIKHHDSWGSWLLDCGIIISLQST